MYLFCKLECNDVESPFYLPALPHLLPKSALKGWGRPKTDVGGVQRGEGEGFPCWFNGTCITELAGVLKVPIGGGKGNDRIRDAIFCFNRLEAIFIARLKELLLDTYSRVAKTNNPNVFSEHLFWLLSYTSK